MNTHPISLADAIERHRLSVLVDEASYNDDFTPVSAELAEKTGAAEHDAFIELVSAPCTSGDEAQAKLRYFLDGSIGVRDTLLDCLIEYGDDLTEKFLRSLVIEGSCAARHTPAHAHAREASSEPGVTS